MGTQINIAAIAPALKQLEADVLIPQFENERITWNQFGEGKGPFVNGKGYRLPSYLRPPTGFGGISEGGSFNTPGAFVLDDMFVYSFQTAFPFEISGRTLRNVNDSSSIIDGLTGIMTRVSDAFKKELNYQAFNDGSGARGFYSSGTGTAAITMLSTTLNADFGRTKGATFFRVGGWYDQYNSSNTYIATQQVSSKTTTIVTFGATVTASAGDYWVPSNSYLKLPRGLAYLVNNDTGTFQLQSRSTYPQLKAIVNDLNGAAITVSDFSKTKRMLQANSTMGASKGLMAVLSLAQDDALCRLGQNYKRWEGNATTYDGSFESFAHGDTVFKIDADCDEDRIYLFKQSAIKKYQEMPFGLYDYDGNELRMKSGVSGFGSDAYTGAMGWGGNLGCETPNQTALIKRCSITGLATQVTAAVNY